MAFLSPEPRLFVERTYGAPRFPTSPASVLPAQKIKTTAFVTYTWDTLDPDNPAGIGESSRMKKGAGWETVVDAARARIPVGAAGNVFEDATQVWADGWGALALLACFDVVVFGSHFMPLSHVEALRSLATRPIEVHVGFADFESINQSEPWNPAAYGLWFQSMSSYLQADPTSGRFGNGLNAYGCNAIDKFETLPWSIDGINDAIGCPPTAATNGGTKHTWDCDTPAYAVAWGQALVAFLLLRYTDAQTVVQIDGALCDNVLPRPFGTVGTGGVATNEYPATHTEAAYTQAWRDALAELLAIFPNAWGNSADDLDPYSAANLKSRFVEHWFRKFSGGTFQKRTLGELQASIEDMNAAGARIMVGGLDGPGQVTGWFTGPGPGGIYGTWADLALKVSEVDAYTSFMVNSARATSGGYLYWQPEFNHPGL